MMSNFEKTDLDYFKLIKEAKKLQPSSDWRQVRLALLADCATQHLVPILKTLAGKNGLNLEIYEGGYDGIELEVINPNSTLYSFAPDFVAVLTTTEKLKARY